MFSHGIFIRNTLLKNTKFVRYKHKENHWSVQRKKKSSTEKALQHFDDFYKEIFTNKWGSIRQGLLNKQKYVALINNYSDVGEIQTKLENVGALNMRVLFNLERDYIKERLIKNKRLTELNKIWEMDKAMDDKIQQNVVDSNQDPSLQSTNVKKDLSLESSIEDAEIDYTRVIDTDNILTNSVLYEFVPTTKIKGLEDFVPESTHYNYYDHNKLDIPIEKEYDINFPDHLNIYTYEKNNNTVFESPMRGTTGVLNYYLMDGGSILPILALDIKPGHKVLDMCAAPGGKSLLALQTLYPDYLVSNDMTKSRVDRIYNVFKMYLYDLNEKWINTNKIKITNMDARHIDEDDFDRIIVDVPCTTDRHSLREPENNIFKSDRIKERLKLPELQSQLLEQGMKLLKPGGVIVYSTCSLSPIQNDGVVHMALKTIHEETSMKFLVKDLTPALLQTRSLFKFADRHILKYGHLILPSLPLNFGPTYFCKLQRIS